MTCPVCRSSNMVYKETITFSNGKTADIYICRECGCAKRDYR